jgi:hypothetical protein
LPSAITKTLGKAGKRKPILVNFPALPSAREEGTRQRIFLKNYLFAECQAQGQKKILCRVPYTGALGKEFSKKILC